MPETIPLPLASSPSVHAEEELAQLTFRYSDFSQLAAGLQQLKLTRVALELGNQRRIVLGLIRRILLTRRNRDIVIEYFDPNGQAFKTIGIYLPVFFGRSAKINETFAGILLITSPLSQMHEPAKSELFIPELPYSGPLHEVPPMRYILLGTFVCIGLFGPIGIHHWKPKKHLLSRRYAIKTCLQKNLLTCLFGYLSIAGLALSPLHTRDNLNQLHTAFPLRWHEKIWITLLSFTTPLLFLGLIAWVLILAY
ncbi:MAG: hypothetical protein Q7Q73_17415 [Verrucomicrobiota bacterium JB024]|nr:hypothetical protein [Verrucomicrobiota bacterium JB024]